MTRAKKWKRFWFDEQMQRLVIDCSIPIGAGEERVIPEIITAFVEKASFQSSNAVKIIGNMIGVDLLKLAIEHSSI